MMSDNIFYAQWHITDRCNLRCIHCYQDDFTSKRELPIDNLVKIADNIVETLKKWDKKLLVTLTGGEPFLYNSIWELAGYLDSLRYVNEINFITNGTFTERNISMMRNLKKLKTVFVSFDGVNSLVNDNIRGEGVFEKVQENIKNLKAENISITAMFTLMKSNINDAYLLYDFVKELKIDGFIIERFVPIGTGEKIKKEVISGEEIKELYRDIFNKCGYEFELKDFAKYRALQVKFVYDEYNKEPTPEIQGAPCTAGSDGIGLLPNGAVLPCRRFYLPLGNLTEKSLESIWNNSEILKNIRDRKFLKGKCKECEIDNCSGCRAICYALTGDCFTEDPQCFYKV